MRRDRGVQVGTSKRERGRTATVLLEPIPVVSSSLDSVGQGWELVGGGESPARLGSRLAVRLETTKGYNTADDACREMVRTGSTGIVQL